MSLSDNIRRQLSMAAQALDNNDMELFKEIIGRITELSKLLEG
jgi:flagellin-specific chaperone FliS